MKHNKIVSRYYMPNGVAGSVIGGKPWLLAADEDLAPELLKVHIVARR